MSAERNLFLTKRFSKEVRKLDKQDRDEIEKILKDIKKNLSSGYEELKVYLESLNSKKFKNCKRYKFYANRAHRVIYAYGRDTGYVGEDSSIFILSYVVDHDKQGGTANKVDDQSSLEYEIESDILEDEDIINYDVNKEVTYYATTENIKQLLESKNPTARPLLNLEQQKSINRNEKGPFIIVGNAGSGKTVISVEITNILEKEDEKYLYLTLTDNLARHVKKVAKDYGSRSVDSFYSIYGFYLSILPKLEINKEKYIDMNKFISGFGKYCSEYDLDVTDVWSEIRGKIKGYMGDKWGREIKKGPLVEIAMYNSIGEEYCKFDLSQRKQIYGIAERYQSWLEENKFYDDNDLARMVMNELDKDNFLRFDSIVVDEIQDLTELQVYMVKKLCKNNNFYMIGDPNQIVSPTLFSFKRIKELLYSHNIDNIIFNLKNNYRSSHEIVDYINRVAEKRRSLIGHLKLIHEEEELAMALPTENEKIFDIEYSLENLKKAVKLYEEQPANAIIVSDDMAREKLIKTIGYTPKDDVILTVLEAKGCEFDQVIILNLISDNYDKWEEIFSGKGKKSSSHRYYFNLYYVALTRARNNIFFIEENGNYKNMRFSYDSFPRVEKVTDEDSLKIHQIEDPQEILNRGENYEASGHYNRAIEFFKKLYSMEPEKANEDRITRCEALKLFDSGKNEEAGLMFMDIEEWELAEKAFYESGNHLKRIEAILNSKPEKINQEDYIRIKEFIKIGLADSEFISLFIKSGYLSNEIEYSTIRNIYLTEYIERISKGPFKISTFKGDNTKSLVRKWLFSKGFRYRKDDSRYPGSPDIVLTKYKTVIFVYNCFFHGHENCRSLYKIESDSKYLNNKVKKNQERDIQNINELRNDGWRVIILWECELEEDREVRLKKLELEIRRKNFQK